MTSLLGWITVFSWICTAASSPAILANMVAGLAIFNYPSYVPERWHVTLMMWAWTIIPFIANFWFRRLLAPLEAIGAILHVGFFIITIITLVVLAQRSSADYVFKTLTHDISGWTNPAVAWGIGLLTVTFPISGELGFASISWHEKANQALGFDSVLHMSMSLKLTMRYTSNAV